MVESPQAIRVQESGRQSSKRVDEGSQNSGPLEGPEDARNRLTLTSMEKLADSPPSSVRKSPKIFEMDGLQESKLEIRIEAVVDSMEKAGFNSPEDFATQYLTAGLHGDSITSTYQSWSRTRHLRGLLAALNTSAQTWSSREAQGFKDETIRSAEAMYTRELQSLTKASKTPTTTSYRGDPENKLSELLEDLILKGDLNGEVRHNRKVMQEEVGLLRFAQVDEVDSRFGRRRICGHC